MFNWDLKTVIRLRFSICFHFVENSIMYNSMFGRPCIIQRLERIVVLLLRLKGEQSFNNKIKCFRNSKI